MRHWIVALALVIAVPVHAELTPEQKQAQQKTIDKDLRRMKHTGEETRRLQASIPNGTPEQKHEYGKLIKQRDRQEAGTPWDPARSRTWPPSTNTSVEAPRETWHPPGNAEIPYESAGRSPAVKENLEATRIACGQSADASASATCQALSTRSQF